MVNKFHSSINYSEEFEAITDRILRVLLTSALKALVKDIKIKIIYKF